MGKTFVQLIPMTRQTNGSSTPGSHPIVVRASVLAAAVLLILALACGCSLLHSAVRTVTGSKAPQYDSVLLQQRLMRFADDFNSRLVVAIDSLPAPTNSAYATARLRFKLNCVSSTLAVATGPNELMNLADMFVLVTLTRAFVEEPGMPGVYGESARPLLGACRDGETNITDMALTIISPQQLDELRDVVAQWRQQNPDLRSALFTRALGLEVEITQRQQRTQTASGSLFSMLRLDPLAGLDPAARELAQTRLFGERTLFLAHRKPTLVRWQAELLVLETSETPLLLEVRSNATETVAALERVSKTVEQLPGLVSSEREAILKTLPSQEPLLTNVAAQLTAMLQAGTKLSDSLNTTLTTVRGMQETAAAQPALKAEPGGAAPHSAIEDYTESARRIELAAQQLTEFLQTLNQTLQPANLDRLSAQVAPVVQQAQAGGRAVTDYAFRTAMLLVAFTCVSVFLTALALRWIRKSANPR